MFDPRCLWICCALLGLGLGCDSDSGQPNPAPAVQDEVVRLDGPAYVASLSAGIVPLAANAHAPMTFELARHRPGRSDLWLQGRTLGSDPKPWDLQRNTLTVPLAGAMVHGLHEMALITAQYPSFPKSAPVYFAVSPAPPARLKIETTTGDQALDQDIARLLYPGQGTLFGASLAWVYKTRPARESQLAILDDVDATPRPITLSGDPPDLAKALSLAVYVDNDNIDILALFLDTPHTLWHWRVLGAPSTLTKIPLPVARPGYQARFDRIGVDKSGVWVSAWEGLGRSDVLARPGDRRMYHLSREDHRLEPMSPSKFGQSARAIDLSIGGTVKSVTSSQLRTQLSLRMDSWNPRSGPPKTDAATLYRWSDQHQPSMVQRCATLSPLLDEIWVGLDQKAQLVAGAKSGSKHLNLELQEPGSPGLALGPLPLDCSVHEGRFLAVRASKQGAPLKILHFDGAFMHEQSGDVSCLDAALTRSGEQSRLWCLRDGSLFPMTLRWQRPQKSAAP